VPFPSNAQYTPILVGGAPLFDLLGDESPVSTDIVGNSIFPAAFFAYDGVNVYFRLRLNGDPRNNQLTSFRNFTWGVLINTSGVAGTYDWLFNVDGLSNRVNLIRNTVKLVNSWNDPAEGTGGGNPNFSQPITNFDFARVTPADSSIGGEQDFFLDWFLPVSTFFSYLGINEASLIRAVFFTSANANNYNKDSLRANEGFSFSNAISTPVSPEQADVRAKLSTNKVLTSGPSSVVLGQQATWTGTITVSNTGLSSATTIFLEDILGPDVLNTFTVNSTSQGLTSYNPSNKTLTWNVGNLAAGATATLTFTVSGAFTSSGSRTLDRVKATGFDSFSGNAIQSNTSVLTVTVQEASTINGTISDQSTGLILPNTTVSLLQGMTTIATTQSNANGFYSFTNVTPGNYTVQASRVNYVTGTESVTASSGVSRTVNIALAPQPSTISGNVSNGGAITNATVIVTNNLGAFVDSTTTDAAGNYTFPTVTPGSYNITVTAPGFQSQTASVITEPNQASIVNFVLQMNPGTITGTIRNTTNNMAIPFATVELSTSSGVFISSTTADGGGVYTFPNLAPGNYQVRAFATNFGTNIVASTVTAGSITTTDIFLEPNPGSIQGTVRDSDTLVGIADATVQVVNSQSVVIATTRTDSNGQYTVGNLLPDSYTLIFSANGYSNETVGAVVTSNDITFVNANLSQIAGVLSGTVQDPGTLPISGAMVTVFQNNIQIASAITDENGNYMISGLAPGSYSVVASAPNYTTESVAATIINGQTTIVPITLNEDPGTLTGVVRDTDNNPISGGNVTVQISTGTGIVIATTVTGADGSYTVPGLAPGNYTVVASAMNFQSSARGVTIVSNDASIVNFFLAPNPGSLEGLVTNAQTGTPISGANIQVRVLDISGALIATVLSDSNGQYLVTGLAPGIYTVVASASNFQTNAVSLQVVSNQTVNGDISLEPNPGQLTGTVVNNIGGSPIVGATVNIVNSSGSIITTVLTDSSGMFMVDGLAPDNYTVNVFADNFQNGSVGALVLSDQSTPVSISLVANPGAIAGTVNPIVPDTIVQLRDVNNLLIDSVVANADGSFSFNNLSPGIYTILASAPNYSTAQVGTMVQSNQTSNVSLMLTPNPGSVSGVVTDSSGNPIGNATVQVFDQNGILISSGFTDATGQYVVGNLPSGSFHIVVNAPGFGQAIIGVTLGVGQSLTGVNVSLIPNPGTINGQVTNRETGIPVPGATVTVLDSISQLPITVTTTTEFGNFTISGLAPGSYIVSATKMNFTTEQIGAIVVSDASTTADLLLAENPGSILGRIEDNNGNPVTGNGIQASVFNENNVLVVSLLANSDGTYFIPSLAPGSYFITVTAPNFGASTVSAIVESNQTTSVTNVLTANPVTLTARVVIENTMVPIPGATVTVRQSNNLTLATGITDRNGFVTFVSLPAGILSVTADAESFGTNTKSVVGNPGDTVAVELELAQNPGQIQGFITNLTSGDAIPNAVIQLYDFTNVLVQTTVSNQFGEYSFQGVSPGVYTVIANAADFGPETAGAIVSSNQTSLLSFALRPNPGIIQGFVRNAANNNPIAGATVEVRELSGTGPIIFTTVTGENGFFQTTTLSPRVYVLVASGSGFGTNSISAEVMGGTVTNVELLLTPNPGAIQGTVRDAQTMQPLADTLVRVIDSQGVVVGTAQTTVDGFYYVGSLVEGSYTVTAITPSYQAEIIQATVQSNNTTILNFNLQGNPATLSGTVIDANTRAPLTGVIIEVRLSGTDILVRRVLTDENGNYLIEGLPQGTFDVTAQLENYAVSVNTVFLSANERERLNIELLPFPATIQGTVHDSVSLDPISGALVQVVIPNTDIVVESIITSSDGTYSIGNLPSGSYNVVISAENYANEIIPVILTPNETETVNALLDPNPATITGTVFNVQTGAGIEGALVRVFDSDGVFVTSTLTDSNGEYSISGLAAGTYTVIASREGFGNSTQIITVLQGETQTLSFGLTQQSATLRGTVRDASTNQPTQTALVQVFRVGTTIPIASVLTNMSGEYVIAGLEPREYRVVFSAETYASEVFRIFLSDGEVQTLNANLQRQPATIRGQVTDAQTGEPIERASIITVINGSGIVVASTLSDQQGNYILTNLPLGNFTIIFSADGYITSTIPVALKPNEMEIINAALEPNPGTITGNVRDSVTLDPIQNTLIQVFLPSGTLIGTALTDIEGNYTILGLPGGTVVVIARAMGYQSETRNVEVNRGASTTVNFLLAGDPASISGFVTDRQTGQPISQVLVQIFPIGSDVPIRSTLTDPTGFYILTGLPAGNFIVRFTASGYPLREIFIELEEGENIRLDVELGIVPPPTPTPPLGLTSECISVDKVYDWVIATHYETQDIMLPPECAQFVEDNLSEGEGLELQCQLSPNTTPDCQVVNVENGSPGIVEVQGTATLLLDLQPINGEANNCTIEFPVYFEKRLALCLPDGLNVGDIRCSIIDLKCDVKKGMLTTKSVGIKFMACIEVEVVSKVKLEVLGEFCFPRMLE
jgi:large repetitive protein